MVEMHALSPIKHVLKPSLNSSCNLCLGWGLVVDVQLSQFQNCVVDDTDTKYLQNFKGSHSCDPAEIVVLNFSYERHCSTQNVTLNLWLVEMVS